MQALAAAHAAAGAASAPCVWEDSDVDALRGVCASLAPAPRGGARTPVTPATSAAAAAAAASSARCGVEEISEDKVLAHIAEAVRLFVRGGHLEVRGFMYHARHVVHMTN